MQDTPVCYVSIPPPDSADVLVDNGAPRLTVERTIIDIVDDLDRPEDLDAVIRTALRHGLTAGSRLWGRALDLAHEGSHQAQAVLDSLARIEVGIGRPCV